MESGARPAHGVAAWRLISEELRTEIQGGVHPSGARMPTEAELAERFGVHRNTVRHAISVLVAEGLLASRRGSGTYVTDRSVMVHRVGTRTRLSTSLAAAGTEVRGELLDTAVELPPAWVAERLGLDAATARRMESRRWVGDEVLVRTTHWFAADGSDALVAAFRETGSITESLRHVGVDDYLRQATVVAARGATADEARELGVTPGSTVLAVRSLDVLPGGEPLQVSLSRFRADRVELDVDHRPGDPQPF